VIMRRNKRVANREIETTLGEMAYFEPLKNNPISSLSRIQGVAPSPKDRRERRAVAESHSTTNAIAEFLSGFRPAKFIGTDGHTYETESKRVADSVTGRAPGSIAFVSGGINIAVPVCVFSVLTGAVQPPFKVNGTAVDYTDPTANFLPLSNSTTEHFIYIRCTIDDTNPTAISTTAVDIVEGLTPASNPNLPTFRYVPLAVVDTAILSTTVSLSPFGIRTIRVGDRRNTENMWWY
jgi:hypothetical protein